MSQGGDPDTSTVYEKLRPLMFSIAYRMLGSATEAEDLVQEAYLRFHRATSQGEGIESPKAYLSTVTTRPRPLSRQSSPARAASIISPTTNPRQ
jgi:RNA polymerase sigma-70 factor (ECF subfamily)